MPDQIAAIELVDVAKDFSSRDGNVQAVEQVDLTLFEGEFFSLLGPSGCGKTTTLRMIGGFEQPTRGEILLYGKDMVGVPPNKRDVNLVFQSYALFPHMNVFENVAFGLRRQKVTKGEINKRVTEMLALVELTGREKRRPREMSGGQQQRVALARALVNRPRALLLDEPLGALDLKLRQNMQFELKRIQREVGITFVYVTHDQGEALTMSDRLVVMNAGKIEQLGTPREIYEQPRTKFVAGFIGTSNIVTGQISRIVDGDGIIEVSPEERIIVPNRTQSDVGQSVDLTVRPEKIVMAAQATAGLCCVKGKVSEVVYLGTSTNYTVLTTTGAEMVVFRQNDSTPDPSRGRGDDVWLVWEKEHSYALAAGGPARASDASRSATDDFDDGDPENGPSAPTAETAVAAAAFDLMETNPLRAHHAGGTDE